MTLSAAEEAKLRGNTALKEHRFDDAIEHYTQAIELDPSNAIFYANRAQAEIKLEQYGAAITDCTLSVEKDPLYVKAFYRRAVAKSSILQHKDALKDLDIVLKLKPNDSASVKLQSELKRMVRRLAFEKAIQDDDADAELFAVATVRDVNMEADYKGPSLDIQVNGDNITLDGLNIEWVMSLIEHFKQGGKLAKRYLYALIIKMDELLSKEPAFKELSQTELNTETFTVVGDVHGQFYDLLNMFKLNGYPSLKHGYLFNGDFVDRGSWSCEVMITLMCFKLLYPTTMHLNRGNHETSDMNKMYGFEDEVKHKYGEKAHRMFQKMFVSLPLMTMINKDYLVMHGGLFSKPDVTLDELRNNVVKRTNPKDGFEMELLWTDPQPENGYGPSKRGIGVQFGPDITERFCSLNGLKGVIRSHEVRMGGYSVEHDGKCITVFSAPNYCDSTGNEGAVINMTYKEETGTELEFKKLRAVEHPPMKPMAYTSMGSHF